MRMTVENEQEIITEMTREKKVCEMTCGEEKQGSGSSRDMKP